MKQISVVVPCFNEEEALPLFYREINKTAAELKEHAFEFIFVDDGSKDGKQEILKSLSDTDNRVRYVSFSRNFGKEAAIYAGLKYSSGDYVVLMDADLQDPPALLPDMLKAIEEEGYDCAATRRVTRKGEPPIRSFFARRFYKIINRMSDVEIMDGARDFRMMTRKMTDAVLALAEHNRFSKGIFSWVGFKTKWFEYENVNRVAGTTKWSFWKLFHYSVEGIVAFSTAPLSVSILLGLLFCVIAFIMIIFIVVKTLMFGDPVDGWPSLACIILFVGGVQLFCTGISGKYISKMYMETKNRPLFIVKEQNIEDEKAV